MSELFSVENIPCPGPRMIASGFELVTSPGQGGCDFLAGLIVCTPDNLAPHGQLFDRHPAKALDRRGLGALDVHLEEVHPANCPSRPLRRRRGDCRRLRSSAPPPCWRGHRSSLCDLQRERIQNLEHYERKFSKVADSGDDTPATTTTLARSCAVHPAMMVALAGRRLFCRGFRLHPIYIHLAPDCVLRARPPKI
jgi:hypothetical protein